MTADTDEAPALDSIPAERWLIDRLFAEGIIPAAARQEALRHILPPRRWGPWTARLLLAVGTALILAGLFCLVAFNWAALPIAIKLALPQVAIAGCFVAALWLGLRQLSGKLLLLSASVLAGAQLAVFGQVYQTGADAYGLFMAWALLILPWVVVAELAALWIVWLVVANVSVDLFWRQAVLPGPDMSALIYPGLMLFNGAFLAAREHLASRDVDWLRERWTRIVLVLPVLGLALVAAIRFIEAPQTATVSVRAGAAAAIVVHILLYAVYRHRLPDMWVLGATILSACIIVEWTVFKAVDAVFGDAEAITYFLMGCFTLAVFAATIVGLRSIAKEIGAEHA